MMSSGGALTLVVIKFVAIIGSALVTVLFLAVVGAKKTQRKDDRPAMRTTKIRMKI